MKRSLEDIRSNMDFVGCDNATALELCAEIERLRNLVADLVELAEELPVNYPSQITKRKILRGQAEMFGAYQQSPIEGADRGSKSGA